MYVNTFDDFMAGQIAHTRCDNSYIVNFSEATGELPIPFLPATKYERIEQI